MWDGRDLSVRSVQSLVSQLKQIEKNNLLSTFEREEIAKLFREGLLGNFDEGERSSVDDDDVNNGDILQMCDLEVDFQVENGFERIPMVTIKRIDVWKSGEEVRLMSEEEKLVMEKLRAVFEGSDLVTIPNLKSQDGRMIIKEVRMVDGLLHNLISDEMNLTQVNRLLYAGSYVVAERLGLMKKRRRNNLRSHGGKGD